MTTDAEDLWWRTSTFAAALVLGCSAPGSGEEDGEGSSSAGTTGEVGFRNGIAAAPDPLVEDVAAPFRLRVGEESRSEQSLLVFSPATVDDEEDEGVLLVIGGTLTATEGRLAGVEAAAVEEIDDIVEIAPAARPGGLPRIPLQAPWDDVGRAVTRLARVTAAVEQVELTGFETALWVVRGRVRVLPGPVVVTARDFFWVKDVSRILVAPEEEEGLGFSKKTVKPGGGPRPGGPLAAAPGGRGPTVGGPGPGPGQGAGGGSVGPTGPSGQVPRTLWPVWPTPPGVDGAAVDAPEAGPARPTLPQVTPTLLGEAPLPAPPAPEPQLSQCASTSECAEGERCVLSAYGVQECSEACADGLEVLCVDSAGCCNIDYVCSEAGTCVQPGEPEESFGGGGGGGCNEGPREESTGCSEGNDGCTGGCNDGYPGCGNGLNEGCNSSGEGCNSGAHGCNDTGKGCAQAGDSANGGCGDFDSGCGDSGGSGCGSSSSGGDGCSSGGSGSGCSSGSTDFGCGDIADGCGDIAGGCGDALGACGSLGSCEIGGRRAGVGKRGGPGRAAMSWFSWLVVFFVVSPRRRRR